MQALREIRIGTAGWSYRDWDGVFYPVGMQRRKQHALEFLAQCFDVVEINTSFYGHIKPELAKLWAHKALLCTASLNYDQQVVVSCWELMLDGGKVG